MKKGDIYYVELNGSIGSEQGGKRPVLILHKSTSTNQILVASLTTKKKKKLPVHIDLSPSETGLHFSSLLLLEQIRPLSPITFKRKIGKIKSIKKWEEIKEGLKISLGL
jgi:mRNA interferase MazF